MKFYADKEFFQQANAYNLKFECEDCAYFDHQLEKCIHGYPNDVHKRKYYESSPLWIIPCKDFELI